MGGYGSVGRTFVYHAHGHGFSSQCCINCIRWVAHRCHLSIWMMVSSKFKVVIGHIANMWPTYNVRACLRKKKKALVFADVSDLCFPCAPSQGAVCDTRQPCPLGLDGAHFTVPLNQVSCTTHRGEIPGVLPLKVKSQHFYFLLDKARHPNTQFFGNPWYLPELVKRQHGSLPSLR